VLKDRIDWEKSAREPEGLLTEFRHASGTAQQGHHFRDQLNARIEALAKSDYKSTDILLDAAKNDKPTAADKKSDSATPMPADPTEDDDALRRRSITTSSCARACASMSDWIQLLHQSQKTDANAPKVAADTAAKTADAIPACALDAGAAAARRSHTQIGSVEGSRGPSFGLFLCSCPGILLVVLNPA